MEQQNAPQADRRLWAVLEQGANALATDPSLAERMAEGILQGLPAQQQALMLLVSSRRAQGDTAGARAMLETMAMSLPDVAAVHYELGLLLAELGETQEAIAALSNVVRLEPAHPAAWRSLGDQLAEAGEMMRAAEAYQRHFASSISDLKLIESTADFSAEQLPAAEGILRAFLEIYPTDAFTLRMLGEVCSKLGRFQEAEQMFARATEMAPQFARARYDHAASLVRSEKWAEANREIDGALAQDPQNLEYRTLMAAVLKEVAEYGQSVACYEGILRDSPNLAKVWLAYAHALKIVGRADDCVAAFRKAIALEPALAEAWWGLSNLKTFRFVPADVEALQALEKREDLPASDRCYLHFALGKALEDQAVYGRSFEEYRKGNALRRSAVGYDRTALAEHMRRSKELFTREFFEARSGLGCLSPAPVFIVGMARSGSTLIEQILASHPAVEGTMELPDIPFIAKHLNEDYGSRGRYPEILQSLKAEELKTFGELYLERARLRRKLDRPSFTDKMPNNVQHLGLIHLILPNARIVDVRRHPMACGFSIFKQYFAGGMNFAYSLEDIGRYYRDYVFLMAHFDAVLPGRVHRVIYEDLVAQPEKEIRKLLDYCGLPFEQSCLRFHETARGIRTASAEQVRQPIHAGGLEEWRNYEPWLGPLKEALGPVLGAYPAVPTV